MTQYQKVRDFNVAFGVNIHEPFNISSIIEHQDLAKLRFNLIEEEILELNDAIKDNDKKEIIDALADILYVAWGAGVSFGLNMDEEYKNYLQLLNITNLPFDFENKSMYENSACLFCPIIQNKNDEMNILFYSALNIRRSLNIPIDNDNNKLHMESLGYNLCDLVFKVYKFVEKRQINMNKAFDIVHDSNMSKLCDTEEIAIKTVQWYNDNDTVYDSPAYRKSNLGEYYVVFNESTGKILKSIHYTPANFDCLLKNEYTSL